MYQNSNKIHIQKKIISVILWFLVDSMFACIQPKTYQKMKDLKVIGHLETSTQS